MLSLGLGVGPARGMMESPHGTAHWPGVMRGHSLFTSGARLPKPPRESKVRGQGAASPGVGRVWAFS